MKRRILTLLMLLQIISFAVEANPVSMRLAREVGAKFINANTTTNVVSPNDLELVTTYRTSTGDAAFHVFNMPQGWIIVAADDCATPILGYSETGRFDENDLPPAMEDYLMGFVEQIGYSIENHLTALDTVAHQWEIVQATGFLKDDRAATSVSPLLTTQWGQGYTGYKYNILCPTDPDGPNGHAITGCVATAMGQIMRYWNYPQTGTGSHSYTPSGYPSQTQYVNFGNTTYDWANMPNALTPSSSSTQNNAVAELLWHCGVSVDMNYGASSSGAVTMEVANALPLYFKYSSDMHYDNRSGFSDSQWLNKIKTDLDNGRPILYRGRSTDGNSGHAFVCDGYNSSDLLHFNWGWYGSYQDSYFALDALTPGSYNYSSNNAAIFEIHPNSASYQVTLSANPSDGGSVSFNDKGDRSEITYGFDDGSMMGWTSIDADGDGYDWKTATAIMGTGYGHNGSLDMVLSQSYDNTNGVLYPDNYLISSVKDGFSQISFYACAQDAAYAAEHFGVAVSTTGNTDASDFTTIQEWTMSAKGSGVPTPGRGGNRTQGTWYQYTVDLSAYAGQQIWVAIRHFNCSDMFYLNIDDITLTIGSGGGNTISATFNEGQTCSVTATPYSGYYFTNWTENGVVVSNYANYSFVVNNSRNLVANFSAQPIPQPEQYTITLSANPSNGGSAFFNNKGRSEVTFDFNDSTMMNWTTIDADGDGYDWMKGTAIMGTGYGHNGSLDLVLSQSYDNTNGVLYPDNYLISPVKGRFSQISFYACAQDAAYAAEHFGVAVSTTGNTDASDFTTIQEWTMSAKGSGVPAPGRGGNRAQGTWYKYTVDLSAYAGQQIWVAIRHFNCSDMFYLDIDDITLTTGGSGGNSISATFDEGQTCTVRATPNSGYNFTNWTENGTVVSNYANYSFVVNNDRNLVANFQPQIQQYIITLSANPSDGGSVTFNNKGGRSEVTFDFNDSTMMNWTTIDADGDGYDWMTAMSIMGTGYGHNGSLDMVLSQSYNNSVGVLYPDNYLISPIKGRFSQISFYACAQDDAYAAEHFGVAVSTTGNTNASDFTTIQEWTMSAKGSGAPAPGRGGNRTQGTWYQYTVDLSAFAGQRIWVAIRHFNCSDMFYLDVDDITLTTGGNGNSVSSFFEEGQLCTVRATPNNGYNFTNWTEDGTEVSTDPIYTFTVKSNRNLVANFHRVHTCTLSKGWNWWSTYIEQEGIDGLGMLENSIGSAGIRIQGRNGNADQYVHQGTSGWYGNLGAITNEEMYKIRTRAACIAEITGEEAQLADHPITIEQGWNWIGFPSRHSISLEAAMSGFTPKNKDVIKGRNGVATYVSYGSTHLWYGTLTALEPGQGYMYKSYSSMPKTLVFENGRDEDAVANVINENSSFTSSVAEFPTNMVVVAVVEMNRQELRSEEYEVAAFVGNECRGSVKLMYVEPLDRYVAFLLVFGRMEEEIHFVLTDGDDAIWSDDVLTYSTDGTEGTVTEPVTLHFGTLGLDNDTPDVVNIFPNPSDGVFNIEGNGIRRIEVINVYGQVILTKEVGDYSSQIDLGGNAAGMYLLRVITNNGITTNQIIKTN